MLDNYKDKITFFKEVINDVQLGVKKYHLMNLVTSNEYNICLDTLEKIINLINTISEENVLNDLQYINNNLSSLIKNYGIYSFNNFLKVCLNSEFEDKYLRLPELKGMYEVISKYLHPINYRIISWSERNARSSKNMQPQEIAKNKIIDDKMLVEDTQQLECFDLMRTTSNFNLRVYGIKVIIHDIINKKTLAINCLADELIISNIDETYIKTRIYNLSDFIKNNNKNELYIQESWLNFYNNLTIKDYLIYSNEELYNKYIFIMNQINNIEKKIINLIVQDFIGSELFNQRSIIIQLLNNYKQEFQYLAYLLYDLLSIEIQSSNDSTEQKILYDSLPLQCKKSLKQQCIKQYNILQIYRILTMVKFH